MTCAADSLVGCTRADDVRRQYAQKWVPLATRGLRRMLVEGGSAFCTTFVDGPGGGDAVGASMRYTAMVLIGLAAQERAGSAVDLPCAAAWNRIAVWGPTAADLGDAGLALWGLSARPDARAAELAAAIAGRREEVLAERAGFASMEMGWLLAGLAEAAGAGVGGPDVAGLARLVADKLLANQHPETALFRFARPVPARNPLRKRFSARLGSFASQVYPTVALGRYGLVAGRPDALAAARRCAEALCRLQGPQGQWWWIYDVGAARAAVRYPVYSVHQDAMGPMALLAGGGEDRAGARGEAILSSLAWFRHRSENPDDELVDAPRGLVWRAVQRDDPRTTGPFGLSARERARMHAAAWLGRHDRRDFAGGFVLRQCRPYHLGWVLLAGALAEGPET